MIIKCTYWRSQKICDEHGCPIACPKHNEHDINERDLKRLGYRYLNGKTSGDMTKDYLGALDIDWINGQIQVKSRYETADKYRPLKNIKRISHLIQLEKLLCGT